MCATTVALGGMYAFTSARTYVATAELKIDRFLPRMANFQGLEHYGNQPYDYVLTQCQVIQSPRIIAAALSDPKISDTLTPTRAVDPVRHVQERLKVQPKQSSQVVSLRLTWSDANEGARLLNAIIDAYMKYGVDRKHDTASHYVKSLQKQREQLRDELGKVRERTQAFMAKTGVVPTQPDGQDVTVAKLADFNSALTQAQIERIRHEARIRSLEGYTRKQWQEVAAGQTETDRELAPLRTGAIGKRQELAALTQRLGDEHPQIRAVKAELAVLGQAEDKALLGVARRMMAQALEAYDTAKSREKALQGAFRTQHETVLSQAGSLNQYLTLRNDEERTQNVYQQVVQRIKELEVVGNEGVYNISVLNAACVPPEPAGPSKPKVLCVAGLIGLGLGLAVVMVMSKPADPGYVAYRTPVGTIGSPA